MNYPPTPQTMDLMSVVLAVHPGRAFIDRGKCLVCSSMVRSHLQLRTVVEDSFWLAQKHDLRAFVL